VDKGVTRLRIFVITSESTPGSERLRQVAEGPLVPDVPSSFPERDPLFTVTLLGTTPIPAGTAAGPTPDGPCYRCCVTCDGVTACACAVQMPCGSCCCPDNCGCSGGAASGETCSTPANETASRPALVTSGRR
jgi:hypothetical protein